MTFLIGFKQNLIIILVISFREDVVKRLFFDRIRICCEITWNTRFQYIKLGVDKFPRACLDKC